MTPCNLGEGKIGCIGHQLDYVKLCRRTVTYQVRKFVLLSQTVINEMIVKVLIAYRWIHMLRHFTNASIRVHKLHFNNCPVD